MKKNQASNRMIKRSLLTSAILLELSMGSAIAATINVDDDCSLAEAITAANTDMATGLCTAGSGDDIIQVVGPNTDLFIGASVGPSTLSGNVGLPIITSNITIEGNGLNIQATPQGSDFFRVFEIIPPPPPPDSKNRGVLPTVSFTLRDTTVTGAVDTLGASGLLGYFADVNLENCNFNRNWGGVFIAYGSTQIDNTVIRHNNKTDLGAPLAAGLNLVNTTASINNSSIVDNQVYYTTLAPRSPERQALRGGGGPFATGGIAITNPSSVTITNSTISGNAARYGGGIGIFGNMSTTTITAANSFLKGNHRGVFPSTLSISNSTITNNSAYLGGGIINISDLADTSIQGSIIAGNKASLADFGREIYNTEPNTFTLDNYNLVGNDNDPGLILAELGPTDIRNRDETTDVLYPLTLSNEQFLHPIKAGSQIIDGLPLITGCFGLVSDQEQNPRALDGDGNGSFLCDVGAFEASPVLVADNAPCTLDNAILSANNDASVGGCTPGQGADVITLPEGSVISITAPPVANGLGLQAINSAVIIEGNNSTIQRDPAATEDFGLFEVQPGADLLLRESTVTGGVASGAGGLGATGGIVGYRAAIGLEKSTVTDSQGFGILNFFGRKMLISESTISSNTFTSTYAAGIAAVRSYGVTVEASSIINNSGGTGAGLDLRFVEGAKVLNSTISGNTAAAVSGLIFLGSGEFSGLTITDNEANIYSGGVYTANLFPFNPIRIGHNIVSGNRLVSPPPDASLNQVKPLNKGQHTRGPVITNEFFHDDDNGPLLNRGFNILGENGLSGVNFTIQPSDVIPAGAVSTVIDPLADNGGLTLTHLPVAAGLAVDGGDTFCFLNKDQLGNPRPFDGDGDETSNCDIGSVEFGSFDDIIFIDDFDPPIPF